MCGPGRRGQWRRVMCGGACPSSVTSASPTTAPVSRPLPPPALCDRGMGCAWYLAVREGKRG
eukprot:76755-Rhodomonas_salina.2